MKYAVVLFALSLLPMRRTTSRAVVLLGLVALGLPAHAGDGRIPIWQPTTLTAAGSYYLSRDIQATSGDILVIASNDVVLDLNGHSIVGGSSTGAIVVIAEGYSNITISNGTLRAGQYGVRAASTGFRTVATLDRIHFVGGNEGVLVEKPKFVSIVHSEFLNGAAIRLGDEIPFGARVSNNVFNNLDMQGGSMAVAASGLTAGLIEGNSITWIGNGISVGSRNVIEGNAITGPEIGISLAGDGNMVRNNEVYGSNRSILVAAGSDDNRIVGNWLIIGSQGVLCFGSRNDIRDNSISNGFNNGVVGVTDSGSYNRISNNLIEAGFRGIYSTGSRSTIEGNTLVGASIGEGLRLSDTSSGTVYRNNVIRGENPLVDEGTGNINGGGNIVVQE